MSTATRTRVPVSPGEILAEEFLAPLGMSQVALAEALGISASGVSRIVKGQMALTARTAFGLAEVFGTTPEFWMNLQKSYELDTYRVALREHHPGD